MESYVRVKLLKVWKSSMTLPRTEELLGISEVVSAQCFKREVSLFTLSLFPVTKNQER